MDVGAPDAVRACPPASYVPPAGLGLHLNSLRQRSPEQLADGPHIQVTMGGVRAAWRMVAGARSYVTLFSSCSGQAADPSPHLCICVPALVSRPKCQTSAAPSHRRATQSSTTPQRLAKIASSGPTWRLANCEWRSSLPEGAGKEGWRGVGLGSGVVGGAAGSGVACSADLPLSRPSSLQSGRRVSHAHGTSPLHKQDAPQQPPAWLPAGHLDQP